jgi:hypothetical protein
MLLWLLGMLGMPIRLLELLLWLPKLLNYVNF